jgi:uncharacterized damage-inducible protein DinB
MSWTDQYCALARYNQLMNRKLYRLAGTLDDGERKRDRGAFFGSIHGTLNHLLLADRVWMLRLTGDEAKNLSRTREGELIQVRALAQELYADFAELREQRERTDADILAWAPTLTPELLASPMSYRSVGGVSQTPHATWWAVSQLFNHQTHHRGQVTTLLHQAGIDPGATDLLAMLRDERAFSA